jgi:cystathionine gamma-synthase
VPLASAAVLSHDAKLDRSTIWSYVQGEVGDLFYARDDHPTGVETERELSALDRGDALLFSSGMAAVTTAVLGLARPGKMIAIAEGSYYGTPLMLRSLEPWGLRVLEYDQTGAPPKEADLVWLEAPANPFLTFPDVEAAVAHPAPVIVDATLSTPILFRPLEHGADLVVHSATKYLGGHHDVVLGVLVCRDRVRHEELKQVRTHMGPIAGPDAAHLLLRSLKTLELRVRRQSESALELAGRLSQHPSVQRVRYPGLGPDPLAARFMDGGFGGLVSFDVDGAESALRVETSTRLIENATSLGGVDSTMEARGRWEGDRVPPGLLRLSVGVEDVEAIWADLDQALASA